MMMGWKPLISGMFLGFLTLAGCDENGEFAFPAPTQEEGVTVTEEVVVPTGETIEQDVEAPEIFEATEKGLWDGRPSLGGVWVAHPDVVEPERALIRNTANGNEVIGALFKRERENPGPRIQVSSDAADALGMLAGQPVDLSVVALKREIVEIAPPPVEETVEVVETESIEAEPLDDPIAAAAAAIDAAEAEAATASVAPASAPAPSTAAAATGLSKPYVQIGIFSVEANANNTAASLRNIGIVPTVLKQESRGKTYWRVIVGPATSNSERSNLLKQVKELGFSDAYYVSQ